MDKNNKVPYFDIDEVLAVNEEDIEKYNAKVIRIFNQARIPR